MVEKAHGITVNVFGIALAVIELIIACFIIYFSINFNTMISGILYPTYAVAMIATYLVGLINATSALLLLGGIYVLVHAIKRIIDYIFKAYIASKQ